MTLLELCEPLFLKVCELNRMARLGQSQEYADVRAEIKELLDNVQRKAGTDARMKEQADKLRMPLTFFADSMIASSKLKFAGEWHQNRLAKERYNILNGDAEFFRLLEETVKDTTDEASERLTVYYACIGLGFVGALVVQPAKLKERMNEILPRIKPFMDLETKTHLCPDAYNYLDARDLTEPPGTRLVFVGILFLFLCFCTMVVYVGMYVTATGKLNGAIHDLLHQKAAP